MLAVAATGAPQPIQCGALSEISRPHFPQVTSAILLSSDPGETFAQLEITRKLAAIRSLMSFKQLAVRWGHSHPSTVLIAIAERKPDELDIDFKLVRDLPER